MMLLFFILTIIILLVKVVQVILFWTNFKSYKATTDHQPPISILLAVRNEESVIERCLESLLVLDYPKDKIQILIGDDNSDDNTLTILRRYEGKYGNIQVHEIRGRVGKQKGKANVLAKLAHHATGEYYFMTDADMKLPNNWISGMLVAMDPNTGLVIGVTNVEGGFFQQLEWLDALGMVKVITDLDLPVTGMGNNMVVSREAYWSVGGYENVPFSITEDYELFRHIKNKKYKCKQVFEPAVLGTTLPIKGWTNLLNQRKRWMQGAIQLPWYMIILLLSPVLFYLTATALLFYDTVLVGILVLSKQILEWIYLVKVYIKLNLNPPFMRIVFFEFYNLVTTVASGIYFLLPIRVNWKGRTY